MSASKIISCIFALSSADMIFKFTQHILLSTILFFSFCTKSFAEINFVETPLAIHIYSANEKEAFISLPLKESFLKVAIVDQKINDKLGSFKKTENRVLKQSKKISRYIIYKKNDKVIVEGTLKGFGFTSEFKAVFQIKKDDIEFEIFAFNPKVNEIKLTIASKKEEQIFGLGEQYSHFNLKGKKVDIIVEENGVGRGDKTSTALAKLVGAAGNEYTSYAPIPFFITTQNRALFLQNSEPSLFDFSKNEAISITIPSNSVAGFMWQANSPKELLKLYTEITGRMPILPEWIYNGAILGLQGGKERVEEIIKISLNAGVPISAIWIQDWVGKRQTTIGSRLQWDWKANENVYPDTKNWIDSLSKEGIKVLGYINPYMVEGGQTADFAIKNNYIVKDSKGKPYKFKAGGFNAYMIDFTNPDAYLWYQSIIKNELIDKGFSGWMADFGEWLPFDAQLHSKISPLQYHNQYPVDWIKLNREIIDKESKNDFFIFNRAGFSYSNKYATTFWTGDQMGNFGIHDGLPSAICALNSSGISGIAINHSDIGGYTAIKLGPFNLLRDKETLFKWMEMEAFTPIFRTHEGLMPDKMSQFYSDEESLTYFATMAKLNTDLAPLFKKFNEEANFFGWPIIRHPYIEFPNDTNVYNLKYQFMLGDTLMVIPNINENSNHIEGYLPEGKWQNYFSREVMDGGKFYNFECKKHEIVAFFKLY